MLVRWLFFLGGNDVMAINTIPSPGMAIAQIIIRRSAINGDIFGKRLVVIIDFEVLIPDVCNILGMIGRLVDWKIEISMLLWLMFLLLSSVVFPVVVRGASQQ